MVRVLVIAVLAACGRIGFDDLHDAGDGDGAPESDTSMLADCELHASALLCEDFEAGLARWPMSVGTPGVVMAPAYAGTGALTGSIQGYPEVAYIGMSMPALTSLTSLHVRARVFVPSGFSAGHINLINLDASISEGVSLYLTLENVAVYRSTPQQGSVDGPMVTRDEWVCVELAVGVADTGGTIELRIADQVVASGTGLDTLPTGGISALKVGIPFSGVPQPGPATVYIDNLVVDVAPIGCTP